MCRHQDTYRGAALGLLDATREASGSRPANSPASPGTDTRHLNLAKSTTQPPGSPPGGLLCACAFHNENQSQISDVTHSICIETGSEALRLAIISIGSIGVVGAVLSDNNPASVIDDAVLTSIGAS